MKQRQQNSTSYPIAFLMVDSSDHVTGKTGLTPTVTISKNGGAFTSPSGAITEIGNGWYALAGNAGDRDTLGDLVIHATATGADPTDDRYVIVPWDPFDVVKLGLTGVAVPGSAMDLLDAPNAAAVAAIQSGLATGTNVSDAQTAIISAVVEIRQEMDSNSTKLASILEDTGTTIPGLINSDSGAGAISHVYTLTDSADGTPIDGAEVWVTTDAAGVNVIASGYTNSSGIINFMLDAGTYYFWRRRSGYNFINPDTETVA